MDNPFGTTGILKNHKDQTRVDTDETDGLQIQLAVCANGLARIGKKSPSRAKHKWIENELDHTIVTHPIPHVALTLATTIILAPSSRPSDSFSSLPPVPRRTRRPSVAWHIMVDVPKRQKTIARKETTFMMSFNMDGTIWGMDP